MLGRNLRSCHKSG